MVGDLDKKKRLPLQISRILLRRKVGLSLNVWPSRNALKRLLQNICMLLNLLYYKHNPFITTVVDGSIFKKNI